MLGRFPGGCCCIPVPSCFFCLPLELFAAAAAASELTEDDGAAAFLAAVASVAIAISAEPERELFIWGGLEHCSVQRQMKHIINFC